MPMMKIWHQFLNFSIRTKEDCTVACYLGIMAFLKHQQLILGRRVRMVMKQETQLQSEIPKVLSYKTQLSNIECKSP